MIKKFIFLLFIINATLSCGFTPALKVVGNSQTDLKVYYEIKDSSYIAQDTLRSYLQNTTESHAEYIAIIKVQESESAVNIDSNGSVLEYKIEILIEYEIIDNTNDVMIHRSQTRGFANYDVSSSEYNNNLIKNEASKTAITEAAQLMSIMIQSKISE